MNIAVVDPDINSSEDLQDMLKNYRGISQICCFRTGTEYICALEENLFQVVFIRVDRTNPNGISLVRRTLSIDPGIEIVFMSENKGLAVIAWDEGARGYLLTPIIKSELEVTMKNIGNDLSYAYSDLPMLDANN